MQSTGGVLQAGIMAGGIKCALQTWPCLPVTATQLCYSQGKHCTAHKHLPQPPPHIIMLLVCVSPVAASSPASFSHVQSPCAALGFLCPQALSCFTLLLLLLQGRQWC